MWCWSSISTPLVHSGDVQPSTGKTTGKREMRQMGFMEESESLRMKLRFPHGSGFGQKKSWNSTPFTLEGLLLHPHALNIEAHSSVSNELLNFHFARVDLEAMLPLFSFLRFTFFFWEISGCFMKWQSMKIASPLCQIDVQYLPP
jgi:hypothetical protein